MGKDIYDMSSKAKTIFEIASSTVGYHVDKMCFEALQDELSKTIHCQICTLAVELAIYEVFKERAIHIEAVAGFSLGEYAALVVTSVIDTQQAFQLVQARAEAMEYKVEDNLGGMVAVLNLSVETVESLCKEIGEDTISIANFNSYKQIVVSGKNDALDFFKTKAKQLKGTVVPLKVNKPFHTRMMRKAADKYHKVLTQSKFEKPRVPLYVNVLGNRFSAEDNITQILYEQIFLPVQWIKTIENMTKSGINIFYEISPKPTLAPFIKNICGDKIKIINVKEYLSG